MFIHVPALPMHKPLKIYIYAYYACLFAGCKRKHKLKQVYCCMRALMIMCMCVGRTRLTCVQTTSGVHGSTGAGSASYGGGAGPVIAMINQVQMISMLGRAGGEKGFPSNKVFSNGFVWSNLDAATEDRGQGGAFALMPSLSTRLAWIALRFGH